MVLLANILTRPTEPIRLHDIHSTSGPKTSRNLKKDWRSSEWAYLRWTLSGLGSRPRAVLRIRQNASIVSVQRIADTAMVVRPGTRCGASYRSDSSSSAVTMGRTRSNESDSRFGSRDRRAATLPQESSLVHEGWSPTTFSEWT